MKAKIFKLCAMMLSIMLVLESASFSVQATGGSWSVHGGAYHAGGGTYILTNNETDQHGSIWYSEQFSGNFQISLDYYLGALNSTDEYGFSGGDGIALAFYATNQYEYVMNGESLGFNGCRGYGVELDSFPGNANDPNYNHVAIVRDETWNHLSTAALSEGEDGRWHRMTVTVADEVCVVSIDGSRRLTATVSDTGYAMLGICAATGSASNEQAVRNIVVNGSPTPPSGGNQPVSGSGEAYLHTANSTSSRKVNTLFCHDGNLYYQASGSNDSAVNRSAYLGIVLDKDDDESVLIGSKIVRVVLPEGLSFSETSLERERTFSIALDTARREYLLPVPIWLKQAPVNTSGQSLNIEYAITGGTHYTCTLANVELVETDPEKEETEPEDTLDNLNLAGMLPNLSFADSTIYGPSVTIGGKRFNLFQLAQKTDLSLGKKVSLQAKLDTEKKTISVLVGYKPVKGSVNMSVDEKSWNTDNTLQGNHDFWESYIEAKSFYRTVTNGGNPAVIRNQYKKLYDSLQPLKADILVSANARIAGYLDFSYANGPLRFREGGLVLGFNASADLQQRIPDFPLAYVALALKASAENKLLVTQGTQPGRVNVNLDFDANFDAEMKIGAGKNQGNFQAYIEGGFGGTLKFHASTVQKPGVEPITASLNGRILLNYRAQALALGVGDSKEWPLFNLQIYPELALLSEDAEESCGTIPYTMRNFIQEATPLSRSYLTENSSAMLLSQAEGEAFLSSSVYPYSEPSMMQLSDGSFLTAWVDDLGNKADAERTSILYSIIREGELSTLSTVAESGTYQDHPRMCKSQEHPALLWMQGKNIPERQYWDSAEQLKHMDLMFSIYDQQTESFSAPTCVSPENALTEICYDLAEEQGRFTVAWVENSENDLFMGEGINTLYLRSGEAGEWGEILTLFHTEQQIVNVDVMESATGWNVVFLVYHPGTDEFRLWFASETSPVPMEIGDGLLIYALEDGHLYYLKDTTLFCDDTPTNLQGLDNFQIVSTGNGPTIFTLMGSGLSNELFFSRYDSTSGEWGPWTQITGYGAYIRDYSPVLREDGSIVVVLCISPIDTSREDTWFPTTDLIVLDSPSYCDLAVDSTLFYDYEKAVPGEELELSVSVSNLSSENLTEVTAYLRVDDTPTTLQIPCALAPGETQEIIIPCQLPQTLSRYSIDLYLEPNYRTVEASAENNRSYTEVGFAELALTADTPIQENGAWMVPLLVRNEGFSTSQPGTISVSLQSGNPEEKLPEAFINGLDPGEDLEIKYLLPDSVVSPEYNMPTAELSFVLTSETEEFNLANNTDYVIFNTLPEQDANFPAPVCVYAVSFDAAGGTDSMDTVFVSEGDNFALPDCTFTAPAGQQFLVWTTDEGRFAPGDTLSVTGNLKVTAVWEDVPNEPQTIEISEILADRETNPNSITVGFSAPSQSGLLIVASYSANGTLLDCHVQPVADNSFITVSLDLKNAARVAAFLVESVSRPVPLCARFDLALA